MGLYECGVDDMFVPYLYPSENGGRADVLRADVVNGDTGVGVSVAPLPVRGRLLDELDVDGLLKERADLAAVGRACDTLLASGILSAAPPAPESASASQAGGGFQLGLSRHSLDELTRARHPTDLADTHAADGQQPVANVRLHFDARHMGLGGDIGWGPSVHPPWMVSPTTPVTFAYSLRALHHVSKSGHASAGAAAASAAVTAPNAPASTPATTPAAAPAAVGGAGSKAGDARRDGDSAAPRPHTPKTKKKKKKSGK